MPERFRVATYAAAGGVVVMLPTLVLGAQASLLRHEIPLSEPVLGFVIGGFFAASALAAYPAGWALPQLGPRLIRSAFLLSAMSMCGVALFADATWQIGVLIAVSGAANPTAQIGLNQLIANHVHHQHQGAIFGIKQASVPFAAFVAGLSVPTLGAAFGWRSAFLAAGLAALVLAALPAPRRGRVPEPEPAEMAIDEPAIGLLVVGGAFAAMTITVSAGFIAIAGVAAGWSASSSGLLLAAGSALGIAGRIGLGWWADRTERNAFQMSGVALICGAAGLSLVALGSRTPVLFAVGTMLVFAGTWSWPGLVWLGVARAWPARSARPMAFVAIGQYAGGILGPLLFGLIAAMATYAAAWTGLAVCALCAATAFILAGRVHAPRTEGAHHR